MCLEVYLAVNLLADVAVIGAASRSLGLFSWRRVLSAGGLGALYALLCACRPVPWASWPVQCAMLAITGAIVCGGVKDRRCPTAMLALCAAGLMCGGAGLALRCTGALAALLGSAAGGILLCALLCAHPPASEGYQAEVTLAVCGQRVRFTALIDTGNRLREPLSGLPVLIVEAQLLGNAVPTDGWRKLRYGAVGGDGEMPCFKPTSVWIGHGVRRQRAPDAWIAVAPGPLPGAFRALAPSVYALYI